MRRTGLAVLVVLLAGGAFAWGFLAHRNQVFPYALLRALGLGDGEVVAVKAPPALGIDAALPYLDGTFDIDPEVRLVTHHDPERAWPGLNFYNSRTSEGARLVDMEGRVRHEWSCRLGPWAQSRLLPNGDVLAVVLGRRILRLDRDSNLLWTRGGRFHHGTWVTSEGAVLALRVERRIEPSIHEDAVVLDDRIVRLSPEGRVEEEQSVIDLFLDSPYAFLLPSLGDREFAPDAELDILHTNHVEVFDGRLADRSPIYARGNLLLSVRNLNVVAIADGRSRKIVWAWGPGNVVYQHQPTLLENGNLLVFSNGVERSQVLEVDPLTRRVVWRYAPSGFFSVTRGSVQRLPNGNTLITESDRGYAFEVTPEKETVWRFANPDLDGSKRIAIWRMTRFAEEELPFLAETPASTDPR